ncbi:MAG: [FeFe] hydrogenase H-cluster radical SAM maturase HydE [Verrucomicrobiota bacterium]|nr:[FeFe] hydrogenase H-cluster radical SAM maturase HydE [Verrucomicrobiota bacterium]
MKLENILKKNELSKDEIEFLLSLKDKNDIQKLFDRAYQIKSENVGKTVYLRGIIEFSNICVKDCHYCGIRKSNKNVERFQMTKEEIISSAVWTYENNYGSLLLQSGERCDAEFIDFIEDVLKTCKEKTDNEIGITISLGEQTEQTYRRWFNAGAHRYLLRIETSNPTLYNKLHPDNSIFEERLKCLEFLRTIGYQVGTGVMIGLPEQTFANLADDILFFRDKAIDMIGMGPYIPHHETPMAEEIENYDNETQLELGLKMVAVTRIVLKDINIAAATTLQTLKFDGREMGLKAGANIIMPNVSDTKYREAYQLYDHKPSLDENSKQYRTCLTQRILNIGESIAFNKWGDSPAYFRKKRSENKLT